MRRRPGLRAPLVVTVVAGAALAACGGAVVTPTVVCPSEAPVDGASCAPASRGGTCGYGSCQGRPVTQAVCDASSLRWRVRSTPCVVTPPRRACPPSRPAQGDACDVALDPQTCNYGWSDCLRGPEVTAICEANTWRLAVATCNPPPPTCPATAPTTGASCALPSSTPCNYGDCNGSPTTFARCEAGVWIVAEASCNPPPPACPAEAPAPSSPCALPEGFPSCSYGSCGVSPTLAASCVGGQWRVTEQPCSPPRVVCPNDAPIEGDACDQPATGGCSYGECGDRPALNYTCRGGRWWLDRAMCGDFCPPSRPRAGSACARDASEPCRYPGAVCGDTQLQNEAQCNPMTSRWVITEFVCR
ncbi:MAG: hypothetical protein R3A48_27970 [Polyangiales bacterium]